MMWTLVNQLFYPSPAKIFFLISILLECRKASLKSVKIEVKFKVSFTDFWSSLFGLKEMTIKIFSLWQVLYHPQQQKEVGYACSFFYL